MYGTLNILHIDMDAFFLSIELNEKPEYKNIPSAVAGLSENRGVILSASYAARRYGIRAGMSVKIAKMKYPELILIQADHRKYSDISASIMEIIKNFSPVYEITSIDEAFLDVSSTKNIYGSQVKIAKMIKNEIMRKFSLTCSIGISENKLLSKIASELKKPDGLSVMDRNTFIHISESMEVDEIPGIGPKTKKELNSMGIMTLGELRALEIKKLISLLGENGRHLYFASRGFDDSRVSQNESQKSIGQEITLDSDTSDKDLIHSIILELCESLGKKLREQEKFCRTIQIKIRYFDFKTVTMQSTIVNPTDSSSIIYATAWGLFDPVRIKPVRLVGVSLSNLVDSGESALVLQPELFNEKKANKMDKVDKALDKLKERFGDESITKARVLIGKEMK